MDSKLSIDDLATSSILTTPNDGELKSKTEEQEKKICMKWKSLQLIRSRKQEMKENQSMI